jgi:hypothetical protein
MMSKMIVTPLFVVTGKVTVDDDVIFCHRLHFLRVAEPSKLVIIPKKGAAPGAQRVLKIVAGTIDTGAGGDAEITFNLDGDLTLPLVDTGLDPETKAKPGVKGKPDYFQGPILPDVAKPNFDKLLDPLHYVGVYPKAQAGGDGKPGGKGGKGADGTDGPILEIWTKEIVGKGLKIDFRGQEGGDGGKGGNGQIGGNGQMGSTAVPGNDTSWTGITYFICKQGPGLGGDGGRGGNAGCGGDGGDGGNGGVFKLFHTAKVDLSKLTPMLQGGKGGRAGPSGKPGKGGKSGPPGFNVPPCLPALFSKDGRNGLECLSEKEGGISKPGQDGSNGYYVKYVIKTLPKIPGLWP